MTPYAAAAMRAATERQRRLTAAFPLDVHQDLQMLDETVLGVDSRISRLLHRPGPGSAGIISVSNKKCAHYTNHECPYLADSNSTLCSPCAVNAAKGQPCS